MLIHAIIQSASHAACGLVQEIYGNSNDQAVQT